MNLIIFRYKCANCEGLFEAPELSGEHYGEFLLRSLNDHLGYLLAISSEEFRTVKNMLKANVKLKNFSEMERATVLHNIFSVVCDLAPDDTEYQIGRFPTCPNCKTREMSSWGPAVPPKFINEEIQPITYKRWSKLKDQEKKALINNAVENYLHQMKID